ncbi:MAG: tetratricopeptide repeat protein [Bacteroidales bacterium]|nr:tetratricopeptide repeat protein [Bacteroidales bacterium]
MLKKSLMMMGLVVFMLGLSAQTVEEAGTKYNEGNELVKQENYEAAIPVYEQALKIAAEAGPDAADLKGNIEKQLGNAYYRGGVSLYKEKKFEAAISLLEKGTAYAKQIGDDELAGKTADLASQLSAKIGDSLRKKDKLDDAFAAYERALKLDPNSLKAMYGEGLVYKEKDDLEKMKETMNKVIELSDGTKDQKIADAARKSTSNALEVAGAKELQSGDAHKAIKLIKDSFTYQPGEANAYYYLLVAYNKVSEWDNAIEAGTKALELKKEDKSEIYFGLGQANEGKGDAAAGCAAYKNVTSGPNVEAAKYQMTQVLKCS